MPLSGLQPADNAGQLPAFTLATALAWLGHDDCRTCPEQVEARADVWLISPSPDGQPSGMRTLMEVRFVGPPWSRAEANRIIAEINVCTGRDRIQVKLRNELERAAIAVMGQRPTGNGVASGREMRPTASGTFDVLDEGVVLATQVPFEVAHEFVHAGCVRCKAGEEHTKASARVESA